MLRCRIKVLHKFSKLLFDLLVDVSNGNVDVIHDSIASGQVDLHSGRIDEGQSESDRQHKMNGAE